MLLKLGSTKAHVVGNFSWKFESNRCNIDWDTAFWSWRSGVVCNPTAWRMNTLKCVLLRLTRIVLTAKRSYRRTLRLCKTLPCALRNLLHPVSRPKTQYFDFALGQGYDGSSFSVFRLQNCSILLQIRLPENYWADCHDIWTTDRADIGPYSIRKLEWFCSNCGCQKQNKIGTLNACYSKSTEPIDLKISG